MQENVYPKGPSVQFYKMFLDEEVRPQLSAYDALAIIEWDVHVVSDNSFEQLYLSAFGGTEDFWVKGSTVAGTTFHDIAAYTDMWHVLGHINGNAIYNNNDPAFIEYVEYTRARWEYNYPYDVALWATISDFPYSWPLWQRYSSKFVATSLVSGQFAFAFAPITRFKLSIRGDGLLLREYGKAICGHVKAWFDELKIPVPNLMLASQSPIGLLAKTRTVSRGSCSCIDCLKLGCHSVR